MLPKFRNLLRDRNIKEVYPLWDSHKRKYVVGWFLNSPSVVRKDKSIKYVREFIKENNLDWWVEDINEVTDQFIVYNNAKG